LAVDRNPNFSLAVVNLEEFHIDFTRQNNVDRLLAHFLISKPGPLFKAITTRIVYKKGLKANYYKDCI